MSEKKAKSGKKQYYTVLMLICIIVFLFALYKVVSILMDYKKIDDYYEKANEDFVEKDDGELIAVDFQKLREINEDVVGWIYIAGTDISYPILQGSTNDFYLFRDYEKNYLVAGSIFLDAANAGDFSDSHTIVYGHNMHNGAMFGTLDKFMEEEYKDEHTYINILTPDGIWHKYEIFSSYIAGIDDGTFTVFAENQQAYDDYLDLAREKNLYSSASFPENGEKILTLSTCTEDSDDYKRYVIHAKYIGPVDKIGQSGGQESGQDSGQSGGQDGETNE